MVNPIDAESAASPASAAVAADLPLRLLIADDQALIRRGLALMLAAEPGIQVVGQAADGLEAIAMAQATQPDVVVMDLQMPRASGVVATREITATLPHTRVVALSTYDDDELVFEAIRAGAQAYLLKDATEAEVLDTIRSVHRGESRLSPTIARKVLEQLRAMAPGVGPAGSAAAHGAGAPGAPLAADGADGTDGPTAQTNPARPPAASPPASPAAARPPEEPLTEREERVLALLSQGLSNKQIAATVFLAEGTVKNYVSRIMEKLHARSRLELAMRTVGRRPAG